MPEWLTPDPTERHIVLRARQLATAGAVAIVLRLNLDETIEAIPPAFRPEYLDPQRPDPNPERPGPDPWQVRAAIDQIMTGPRPASATPVEYELWELKFLQRRRQLLDASRRDLLCLDLRTHELVIQRASKLEKLDTAAKPSPILFLDGDADLLRTFAVNLISADS